MSIKDIFEFVINFNLIYLIGVIAFIWILIYVFGIVSDFVKAFREGYKKKNR